MKITELISKEHNTISFEVFPPKTDSAFESVAKATAEIAALKPLFISVTYGAGGGTSAYTVDITKSVQENYGVPGLAHLTCVSSDKSTVARQIENIHSAGIENIMALRGDLTEELMQGDRSKWAYRHASELINDIRSSGYDFCIGAACYPEVHPESENSREDIKHLKEKVDCGADFLTTQMFFDNSLFYSFLYRIREAGISVPVIPGIMPITNAKQVERAVKLSGSFMPKRFLSLVDCFGSRPEAMNDAGIIYACDQIIDLYANGINHIHVYSMNKPAVAEGILKYLGAVLG